MSLPRNLLIDTILDDLKSISNVVLSIDSYDAKALKEGAITMNEHYHVSLITKHLRAAHKAAQEAHYLLEHPEVS